MLWFRDGAATSPLVFSDSGHPIEVPGWAHRRSHKGDTEFVSVGDHEATLTQMLLSHQDADLCLVGGKVVICLVVCCVYVHAHVVIL